MSEDTNTKQAQSSTARKTITGEIFTVETVPLPQREQDEKAREMGVVWITDASGEPVRFTDFSGMHKVLVEDKPVKAVFDESVEPGDNPRIHRNLVSFVQPREEMASA